jgi:serine/threonine-protein kinase RsbW
MAERLVKMQMTIPPIEGIEDVPVAAVEALATKMGFSPDRVQDIAQALTEACVNAIIYSESDADVEVVMLACQNSLILEVRDQGPGFEPDDVPAPNFELISELGVKNGGFGIHMIKALVDQLEIESSSKGTVVRMSTFLSKSENQS